MSFLAPSTAQMIVEGYAALFGVEDQMHDIVRAGAFAAGLARRGEPLPLLVEHDPRLLAGYWTDVREDTRGLWLVGEVRDNLPGAARARRMIARGVDGLSIGFIPLAQYRSGAQRVLTAIDLLEVSIVTYPMQPQARLTLARELVRAA
ncbi:MAG: HK97 family phage prohead protease [Hyphomonadaceae bacterium]